MRMRLVANLLAALLGAACGPAEPPVPVGPPAPPSKADDPAYSIRGARDWYLVGDALTTGHDALELTVDGPPATEIVDLWLDGRHARRAARQAGGWTLSVDVSDLPPGIHDVLLAADGEERAFARLTFRRSHPLYVAVSNDWDTGDHGDDKLERQDRLHANHPAMVMTHFVGPYTFTDPSVSPARAQQLVDWLTRHARDEGDEIGLHVHPYCHFVTQAGVACRSTPSFAKASDPTGYTVVLGAYTRPELDRMFAKATELFAAHGLPAPTSFRAGGWTATLDVLKALAAAGHVADASACNWARLEEWEHVAGAQLFAWNRENWSTIDEHTQPYYPNVGDLLSGAAPHLDLLEVPDNGALVDYVTSNEMIDMFRANYAPGEPLAAARQYSIGYHPVNFSEALFARIDATLDEIDRHLAADDRGPVVYARMSDLPRAFPRPQ